MKKIFERALWACGSYLALAFACAAVMPCGVGFAAHAAELSAINDIELRSGSRGLILIISGSGAIAVGGQTADLEKATARYAEIRVRISKASSALGAETLTPPGELPIREIALRENSGGMDISIKMRAMVNGPVQIRGGGNQVRILLTKDPQAEMVWSSSKGVISAAQPAAPIAPQPNVTIPSDAERVLGDIRVVERDNSAALYFDFTGAPAAAVNRWDDSAVVTFAHTSISPKLGAKTFAVNSFAYGSVRISQKKDADGKSVVTASVRLKLKGASPIAAAEDNRYVLRLPGGARDHIFLWSALMGVQSSQQFADIKPEPLDAKRMEARAVRDTQTFAGGRMFSVGDAPQARRAPAPVSAGTAPVIDPPRSEVPVAIPEEALAPPVRQSPDEALVRYKVFGRDPFVPLVRDTSLISELPRVENLKLVGVLEDSRERIALLEDYKNGNRAFALRVNDPVEYGKVLRVHRDKVVFLIRDFDVSRSYTLGLSRDAKAR